MAKLVSTRPSHYDVLAEALTADGRVVKRVEARADSLPDVTEAFRLAAAEATKAHTPPARLRLTASRAGVTEIAVTDELMGPTDPMVQSALLDGKTKLDAPPVPTKIAPAGKHVAECTRCGWMYDTRQIHVCRSRGRSPVRWTVAEILAEADRQRPSQGPFMVGRSLSDPNRPALQGADGRIGDIFEALSGPDCGNWRQYDGFTLAEIVYQRLP